MLQAARPPLQSDEPYSAQDKVKKEVAPFTPPLWCSTRNQTSWFLSFKTSKRWLFSSEVHLIMFGQLQFCSCIHHVPLLLLKPAASPFIRCVTSPGTSPTSSGAEAASDGALPAQTRVGSSWLTDRNQLYCRYNNRDGPPEQTHQRLDVNMLHK